MPQNSSARGKAWLARARPQRRTRENGLKNGEDALVANPDLKAIYGANGKNGMGAAQAAAAGKTKVLSLPA